MNSSPNSKPHTVTVWALAVVWGFGLTKVEITITVIFQTKLQVILWYSFCNVNIVQPPAKPSLILVFTNTATRSVDCSFWGSSNKLQCVAKYYKRVWCNVPRAAVCFLLGLFVLPSLLAERSRRHVEYRPTLHTPALPHALLPVGFGPFVTYLKQVLAELTDCDLWHSGVTLRAAARGKWPPPLFLYSDTFDHEYF